MYENDIINPSYFLNWLKLQEPTREFGGFDRCKTCPLASFLVEAMPFMYASVKVGGFNVSTGGKVKYYRLPEWAEKFVWHFDVDHPFDNSADKAIRIMETLNV